MRALKASGAADQQSRCAAKMDSDSGLGRKRHYLRAVTAAIPLVFSVASVAFCILLGLQTSALKSRMLDFESSHGERLVHPLAEVSIDELNSMVQERVDEVLSQVRHVLGSRGPHSPFTRFTCKSQMLTGCFWFLSIPQRDNYYHRVARVRTAREVSPECNCPPGNAHVLTRIIRRSCVLCNSVGEMSNAGQGIYFYSTGATQLNLSTT